MLPSQAIVLASHIHSSLLQTRHTVQPSELILVCGAGRDKDGEGTHQDGHAEARTNIQTAGKPCYQNFLRTGRVVSTIDFIMLKLFNGIFSRFTSCTACTMFRNS